MEGNSDPLTPGPGCLAHSHAVSQSGDVRQFHFNTDRKICVFLFNVGGTTFLIDMPLDMDFKLPI